MYKNTSSALVQRWIFSMTASTSISGPGVEDIFRNLCRNVKFCMTVTTDYIYAYITLTLRHGSHVGTEQTVQVLTSTLKPGQ